VPKEYMVQAGDCISSIAYENGFFYETIWNYPDNATLKVKRKDPNTIFPGDIVVIPDKREKVERRATGSMHRFRIKAIPAKLRLQILSKDKPRANQPYQLDVDGIISQGMTDAGGNIVVSIPPDAKQGKLIVGKGDRATSYDLLLGHLDPVDEITGVQARLNNLGFYNGDPDGVLSPQTAEALGSFQASVGLSATGKLDAATRAKLRQTHSA
jgi:hypothetical protein